MRDNETLVTGLFQGEPLPTLDRDVFLALGWLLVVNGIFGNIVIIITLFTCKDLRSVHNLFIGNLAVADFIIESYFATLFLVDISIGYHPVLDMTNCIINGYIVVVCYMSSLWTLVSISFNRYLHICHHHIFKVILTDSRTKCHLVLVWLWAGLISLPPVLGWGRYNYDPKAHYCGFDRLSSRSFTIVLATSSVALPCILVCYFNFAIFRYVRDASQRVQTWTTTSTRGALELFYLLAPPVGLLSLYRLGWDGIGKLTDPWISTFRPLHNHSHVKHESRAQTKCRPGRPQRGVSKSDISLMKSLFAVFVCLAVFMTPYMMSLLLDTDNSWTSSAHVACTCTSILNSSINWLLYGLMNNQLRQGYSELFGGLLRLLKFKQDGDFMAIVCEQKQETFVENTC